MNTELPNLLSSFLCEARQTREPRLNDMQASGQWEAARSIAR